jgi:HD-GYP domain-containing protein (c-di-GMP phosphodiesterase class II)
VLARALKLDEEEVRAIACGALLHEIGKLEIPEAILRKPAVLTAEERRIMREYCLYGYEIVRKEASLQPKLARDRASFHISVKPAVDKIDLQSPLCFPERDAA